MAKEKEFSPGTDLLGFVLGALAVFLFLALYSYSPNDPSFSTQVVSSYSSVANYGGIIGSYVADLLFSTFGFSSYLFVFLLCIASLAVIFAGTQKATYLRLSSLGLFLYASCVSLALLQGEASGMFLWGGVVGHLSKSYLATIIGIPGTIVMVCTLFLMASTLLFSVHIKDHVGSVLDVPKAMFMVLRSWGKRALASLQAIPAFFSGVFARFKTKRKPIIGNEITAKRDILVGSENTLSKAKTAAKAAAKNLADIPIVLSKKKDPEPSNLPKKDSDDINIFVPVGSKHKYKLPSLDLLSAPKEQGIVVDKQFLLNNADLLEKKLKDFGVDGKVVEVQPGPVVTMYEFEPAPGIKVNKVMRLNDDLAMALRAMSVRISLIPGKAVIGIEVANKDRQVVYLKNVLADPNFANGKTLLSMGLGKDISGNPYISDLRTMPHLLVAGATGSGKSVAINSMITSLLYKFTPDQVRMILVDPKMLELNMYDDIPHLLLPVVTDPRKASAALRWAVNEMERRYKLMADLSVRNIEGYNKKVADHITKKPTVEELEEMAQEGISPSQQVKHEGSIPFIMIVIDELADLMMVAGREVEESIIRLAQMARAAGIHLLLATQRPSVDVITGVIKANMPSRIAFQVSSRIDSRTIIDTNGAEMLLGAGDMLFMPPGTSKLIRVHGAFISDQEVKEVTDYWKAQARPNYNENILRVEEEVAAMKVSDDPDDELYVKALGLVKEHGTASISMIQRRLRIGYNRSARLVERMGDEGYLAPAEPGKPREILPTRFGGL